MATTYTHDNFTPSAVPTVFKKDVAALIAAAVELGWTFMVKADNNATLVAPAPNEEQNIHLSSRRNSGPLRRLHNKIVKYGKAPVTVGAPKVKTEPVVEQAPVVVEQSVVDWDAAAHLNAEVDQTIDEKVEELVEDALKTIVRTGPMICKQSNNKTYESPIATQREWSDGSIDYVCTQCDYVNVKPRSMSSHWKWHVREDESLRIIPIVVDKNKLTGLAAVLRRTMESGVDWSDLDEAARQLATAALHSGQAQPAVTVTVGNPPTTDAEILDAIRGLVIVNDGTAEKIAQLEKDVARLQKVADAAEAEAAAAKSTLATFRDLINESV